MDGKTTIPQGHTRKHTLKHVWMLILNEAKEQTACRTRLAGSQTLLGGTRVCILTQAGGLGKRLALILLQLSRRRSHHVEIAKKRGQSPKKLTWKCTRVAAVFVSAKLKYECANAYVVMIIFMVSDTQALWSQKKVRAPAH